jgi:hypothetical protein
MRLVWRGIFDESEEEWTFGLNFTKEKAGSADVELAELDDTAIKAATAAFMNTNLFGPGVKCMEIRGYDIGTDGKMVGEPRYVTNGTSHIAAGTGTSRFPPQVALVATLRAAQRGPARLGRIYLPGPAQTIGSDWRLSVANQTNYLNAVVTFIKAAANSWNASDPLFDVAAVNVSKVGAGALQRVEFVSVGRVLDTQRRRRNKLVEERVESGDIDW